jgi:hypothetical protein
LSHAVDETPAITAGAIHASSDLSVLLTHAGCQSAGILHFLLNESPFSRY